MEKETGKKSSAAKQRDSAHLSYFPGGNTR